MVKKKKPGRPKGSVNKKAVKKKTVKKIRKRGLPDFIKGQYIIVNEDRQLNWTLTGWRAISDNVDDPIQFPERAKAIKFIKRNMNELTGDLNGENQAPESALMKDHYQHQWKVSKEGMITSITQPLADNPAAIPLRQLVKAERKQINDVVVALRLQLRDAQKVLDKFDVSMEKYGL